MENRKKRINLFGFVFTLFITLCIITFSFFWVIGSNSYAKSQYEEKNSKEVKQLTAQSVEKIETIDIQEILDGVEANQDDVILPQDEQEVLDQELTKIEDGRKQELLTSLAEEYSGIMDDQKTEALKMLDNLIAQGKEEWKGIVARGENTPIVKGEKVSEYLAMVNVMEKNMDESFETILAKMQEQLEAEGIEADPILNQYREKYNSLKEENRTIMMDKAIKAIKGK